MKLPPFLPTALRDLARLISPLAFEVIDWKSLGKSSSLILTRLLTGSGTAELQEHLRPLLGDVVEWSTDPEGLEDLPRGARKDAGEKILAVYFRQLQCPEGLFLDLRPEHFGWNPDKQRLTWNPTALWTTFSPDFHAGLKELYHGFYNVDEARFEKALLHLGLVHEGFSAADVADLKRLLFGHFGKGDQTEVKFTLKKFQGSFHELFEFLLDRRVKLTADFLLLGIYLVTLYLALEKLGASYNVRQAFLESTPPR